jgi:hypothetical protein
VIFNVKAEGMGMSLFMHVDRSGKLNTGSTLKLYPRPNECKIMEYAPMFADGFAEHIETLCATGLSRHGLAYLMILFDRGNHMDLIFKELYLEYVRWKYGCNKPSRLQSLFAWGSIEEAMTFADLMLEGEGERRIVEVAPLGRVFKADMNLRDTKTSVETALSYWNGERLDDDISYHPVWEYLMEYPVRVMREVSGKGRRG